MTPTEILDLYGQQKITAVEAFERLAALQPPWPRPPAPQDEQDDEPPADEWAARRTTDRHLPPS